MDQNSEISDSNLNVFHYTMGKLRGRRMRNSLEDNKVKTLISFGAFEFLIPVIHAVGRRLLVNSGTEICMVQRHIHLRFKW